MRRMQVFITIVLLVLALNAGDRAATKSYQFTGIVKAVTADMLTVEKSSKETWQFEVAKDTKGGTPKVGDHVTVHYKMVTTEIESKAAAKTSAK
jgi:hydrogenase maturation factor